MVNGVKNAGKSAISAIKKGISKAKEFVSTVKHNIVSIGTKIGNAISNVLNKAQEGINKIKNGVSFAFKTANFVLGSNSETIKSEAGVLTGLTFAEGMVGSLDFLGDLGSNLMGKATIKVENVLGFGDFKDNELYSYANNEFNKKLNENWKQIKQLPGAIAGDFKNTFNPKNIINYAFNPNITLEEATSYQTSIINTVTTIAGAKAIFKKFKSTNIGGALVNKASSMASKLTEKLKVGKSVWENYVAESQKLYCTDPNMRVNTRYSWKIGSAEDAKYLGKGNVGDFSNLEGATIEEVLSRIPEEAVRRELIPEVGKVTEGFEYKWVQDGKTYRVRIHGADASAPAGSNAANGWVVRVQQGKKYLDPNSLEFQPPGITNIASPNYSEELANSTHIPIKSPE